MKLPKRFGLSTLLLVMLVVAIIFGYAQWRRQWLIAEVERLGEYTTVIEVSDNWFWPTVTPITQIVLVLNGDGQLSSGDQIYDIAEAEEFYRSTAKQLRAIEVEDIKYSVIVY